MAERAFNQGMRTVTRVLLEAPGLWPVVAPTVASLAWRDGDRPACGRPRLSAVSAGLVCRAPHAACQSRTEHAGRRVRSAAGAPHWRDTALCQCLCHGRVAAKTHEIKRRGDDVDADRVRGGEKQPGVAMRVNQGPQDRCTWKTPTWRQVEKEDGTLSVLAAPVRLSDWLMKQPGVTVSFRYLRIADHEVAKPVHTDPAKMSQTAAPQTPPAEQIGSDILACRCGQHAVRWSEHSVKSCVSGASKAGNRQTCED